MNITHSIPLGCEVLDTISGITGILTARTVYLHSTQRVCVQRQGVDNNGTPWGDMWLDGSRIVKVEA